MRLFNNPALEMLSKVSLLILHNSLCFNLESLQTPWYLPLLFWIPIITYLISSEAFSQNPSINVSFMIKFSSFMSANIFFILQINAMIICEHLVSGFFFWTFLEYTLHRYLFHMNVKNHPKWSTFHFLLHGLHHKVSFIIKVV